MKPFIFIVLVFVGVKGFGQQPVFVNDGRGNLYSLNLNNCTSRLIGNTGQSFQDIAFTPNGNLWGISENSLYQIDTTNALIKLIGFSYPGTFTSGLVALNDSTLLGDYNDSLYGINTKNSEGFNIGYIGYEDCGDLSWVDNILYMNTCAQLIRINFNSNYTNIINSYPINNLNSSLPQMYGLATTMINGINKLVGFAGPYAISTLDGTYQEICENLDTIGAYGAASMSFPSSLPVNLLNFTSTLLNNSVKLQWQTTSEINSSYFLIERSFDGVNFSGISKVNAAGNSTSLKQYSFIDQTPLAGEAFYRLKEVDLDGKYVYSKILLVKMPQANTLNIIGNPVQNVLQIQIDNSTLSTNYLSIFDFSGRRLKTFNAQCGLQNIDVSFLSAGSYILQLITADGKVFDKPFVKR
jgi:hypothetical protein